MQNYYTSRLPKSGYRNYWGMVVDPDGVRRDRLSEAERVQWIADNAPLIESVRRLPGPNMCDVGCGPGWLLRMFPDRNRIGVETARELWDGLIAHDITCNYALQDLLPCHQDIVVAHHVIEHIADPIAFIGDVRRVLRPGGWLVLGTPDFDCPCAQRFGENYRMLHDPTHVSLFTLESMHRFLRDHGFTIERVAFPFPDRYATPENFARWNDTSKVSPPWPGNWMTFYARR